MTTRLTRPMPEPDQTAEASPMNATFMLDPEKVARIRSGYEKRSERMISLEDQIEAVWEAQDAPSAEAAEYRRTMTGLRPGSSLWTKNKLSAEAADRQRSALLAAHDTLRRLAAI